ncbi:hypothetical protein Hanom_Chr09g00860241 [Helianthus anomalus]
MKGFWSRFSRIVFELLEFCGEGEFRWWRLMVVEVEIDGGGGGGD